MSLTIQNIWKTYQQGETRIEVLRDLSFEIGRGETVAILGQSGSGKSTLLSLLAGLDQPDRGRIEIAGQNFAAMSVEERTRFRGQKIGIVFQQFHLVPHLSAFENVMLPMEIQGQTGAKAMALELLSQVGLAARASHFPSQMSGGECQRVAIARAMITRPEILLADEPSGSLDLATGETVMALLFDLVRKTKMSMVLVTHNPEIALRCNRRLHLKNGHIEVAASVEQRVHS